MDEVEQEVENLKKQWDDTYKTIVGKINSIANYGKYSEDEQQLIETQNNKKESLPRMKGIVQDGLSLLNSLIFKLDLFAPQLPNDDQVESAKALLESWQNLSKSLRQNFRDASLQANENIRKAAQKERELLLGGGPESTARRRNLQTKAGMTSAAESITESLRRTRQMMVQEVERTDGTLMTLGESTEVLGKAESEYKGHRSLLMRTRNLLSTMQRQDVIDRIIIGLGFFLFTCAVLYVVSKRIGILKLQRHVTAAFKAGMVGKQLRPGAGGNVANRAPVYENAANEVVEPLERLMHDEL